MRLPAFVLLALALAAAPATGVAAEDADLPTLAVPLAKAADLAAAEAVAAAVATEAARFPVKPVSGADLSALAGPEKLATLPGCVEASCLAGLSADYLLSSELTEQADHWALTVDLLLVRHGKSVAKTTKQAPRSAPLAELAADAAAEVLLVIGEPTSPRPAPVPAPLPEPQPQPTTPAEPAQPATAAPPSAEAPTPSAASAAPASPDEPAPPLEPGPTTRDAAAASQPPQKHEEAAQATPAPQAPAAAVQAPASGVTEKDIRLGGYVLDGVGAALLVGGLISGAVAMSSFDAARAAKTAPDFESARDRGKVATVMADALYGIGGAVAAVGLIMTFFPVKPAQPAPSAPAPGAAPAPEPAPAPAPVSLAPALLPGGAGLLVSGGF